MSRTFSANQKLYLITKARFTCQICGCSLRWSNFHADHIVPYSKGGKTILSNGQALCIKCNLGKGVKKMAGIMKVLPWQQRGLKKYKNARKAGVKNITVEGGTGVGKTLLGCLCARRDYEEAGGREKVVIVVFCPYNSIKDGWEKNFENLGLSTSLGFQTVAEDIDVMVSTYAGATNLLRHLHKNMGRKFILIFDEFHHLEVNNTWALPHINMDDEDCVSRILLSGTPWREGNGESLPFVEYSKKGLLKTHFRYTYGQNVNEGSIDSRNTVAVVFHGRHAKVDYRLTNKDTGEVKDLVFDTRTVKPDKGIGPAVTIKDWNDLAVGGTQYAIQEMIIEAISTLDEIRKKDMKNAAGIVFVSNITAANQIVALFKNLDPGVCAVKVTSDDPKAGTEIKVFKGGKEEAPRWIIAVDMVSEGTDIPRLKVAVDLSNRLTLMSIMQRWGRVLRIYYKKVSLGVYLKNETPAHIFFFKHPKLVECKNSIEEDINWHRKEKVTRELVEPPPQYDIDIKALDTDDEDITFKGNPYELDIHRLAEELIKYRYEGLKPPDMRYALMLAKQMINSKSVPDFKEDDDECLEPEPAKATTTSQKKSEVAKISKLSGCIANIYFEGDYSTCGGEFLEFHNTVKWTSNQKTLDQIKHRHQLWKEFEAHLKEKKKRRTLDALR